ncbi:MAG: hypothetical protein ACI95C_002904 [Pseudohongiellaceae bacterium]|jgi:uncharacterized protein (TIGR01777 family)
MNQSKNLNILVTGASGMIGSAITVALTNQGYTVYPLLRNSDSGPFRYLQSEGKIILDPTLPLFAVINLAGENIADKRWSPARKKALIDSRQQTTQLLSEALAQAPHKPEVFLSASAIGYYGSNPVGKVDESSPAGEDFFAEIATKWEAATEPAIQAGIRTAHLRFGIVLSTKGGVLKNFLLPLNLAVVGATGNGQQKISWISIVDAVRFLSHGLHDTRVSGPVNLVAKGTVSSLGFAKILSATTSRFRLPTLPAPIVRLMFGEMADAALLASADIKSTRLNEFDFSLVHENLTDALTDLLSNRL